MKIQLLTGFTADGNNVSFTSDASSIDKDGDDGMSLFLSPRDTKTEFNNTIISNITDSNDDLNSINENALIGSEVGIKAYAVDPDGSTVKYSLIDSANNYFSIDEDTGVVTLKKAVDYESESSYEITVQAQSFDGSVSNESFTINVENDTKDDNWDFDLTVDTQNLVAGYRMQYGKNANIYNLVNSSDPNVATTNFNEGIGASIQSILLAKFFHYMKHTVIPAFTVLLEIGIPILMVMEM